MKQNEIEKLFDWYTIDEAVEICINKTMQNIERKLDYQHRKFVDNVIVPFDGKYQHILKMEKQRDEIMSSPFLRGIYSFAKAVRNLNDNARVL